jgi:4-hydroxy-3-methylbut-2-enyl diphosphate reductase
MKIELAENYGFCFGVKRAIKIAEESKNAVTFGPLIHNNLEIKRLKDDFNVSLSEDITQFTQKDSVIIRTHGIEKQNLNYLKNKNIKLIDATCPFVTKPQQITEEMSNKNYDVVIFGDKNHPEIKGVMSYAKYGATVVLSIDELIEKERNKKLKEPIALVSQTTRKIDEFLKIANYLIKNHKEVRVFNTICNATFENQQSAKKLSEKSDVMVVIGGKNSSNTKQLLKICLDNCKNSHLVESENDLQKEWFENKKQCGITAGASTPDWIIEKIYKKIQEI